MKVFPMPMTIDCDGLSTKWIRELADHLSMYFEQVVVFGDDITVNQPVSIKHYNAAWRILDHYGVKVTRFGAKVTI